MSEKKPVKKFKVSLIPGADTPEGAARIQKELEARNDIDFRAFQLLQRLADDGLLYADDLIAALRKQGESKEDAKEIVDEVLEELREIRRARRLADHKVLAACAGRPE